MAHVSQEDALQRFETIWNYVECGIAIIDAETREILDVNPVAARMFGDSKEKMIGRVCHRVFCPAQEHACPIIDLGQVVDRSERKFVKSDGSMIPIVKSVARIQFGGRPALLESFTDISLLKEAEEKLRVLQVAEQANSAKSNFLSRMSHEMRTPMNAIIGMTKIAESSNDVEKLRYCLSVIDVSAEHLLGLINDVLDIAKIESGKLELAHVPIDIESMLVKVCNLVAEKVEEKRVTLRVTLGEQLKKRYMGDDLRLSQIVTNLMSNAVKFTPEGGEIRLTMEEISRTEDTAVLRLTVTDTGIGMTEAQIAKVFNAFEQADTSISRKFGGTGLGLVISKNIAEKMGGSIAVASKPGEGSAFTVDVMVERIPEAEESILAAQGDTYQGFSVLAVAGNREDGEQWAAMAQRLGASVEQARNGAEALRLAGAARDAGKPYDLVLLDDVLPDMRGLEAAMNLSAMVEKKNIVLVTTFLRWTRMDTTAQQAGVSRFVVKPLFPSSLARVIRETMQSLPYPGPADNSCDVPDFSHVNLLLAEDVPINREIFITLLEDTGIRIDVAENGLVAVEKFRAAPGRYNIIMMDVQMPGMDGCEATRAIRAMEVPGAPAIPIIAMTANVFKEDIDYCLSCGMDGHIPKPIDEEMVIAAIRRYCGG